MARVSIAIEDHVLRITVDAMVRAAGHSVDSQDFEIVLMDTFPEEFGDVPTLLFANAAHVPEAIAAIDRGAYDYVYLPLQPGDLERRIDRALSLQPASETSDELLTLEEAEQRVIQDTVRRCNNNRAEAARRLGIGRNTLWRKLKKAPPAS